jgi:hypothetical protein
MELLFLIVWKMRQEIEFQKSRSTLQALMSQKGADEKHIKTAFDDLRNAFFPYDKNQKTDELRKMREALRSEMARGPLQIQVTEDPNKKKVKSRLVRGQADLEKRQQMEQRGNLSNMDAFSKARGRTRKPGAS